MSVIQWSIVDFFEQQYGYRPAEFDFSSVNQNYGNSNKGLHNTTLAKGGSPLWGIGHTGRDYFMPITLTTPSTPVPYTTAPAIVIPGQVIQLPYPIMRIECRKRIVETPLTERNGTVKELINIEDYHINVRGIIISKDGSWPEDDIKILNDLFRAQTSLKMRSALSDIFLITNDRSGSDQVVITDLRWPESKGGIDVRFYEMELVSDVSFSLEEI